MTYSISLFYSVYATQTPVLKADQFALDRLIIFPELYSMQENVQDVASKDFKFGLFASHIGLQYCLESLKCSTGFIYSGLYITHEITSIVNYATQVSKFINSFQ